jgi:putative ABC transport system permease protein
MTSIGLAWRLLRARGAKYLLTAAMIAVGTGLMLASVAGAGAARGALSAAAVRFPLVVGGDVGAVPLVLGTMTRLEDPPARLPARVAEELAADPRVEAAVPLLGGHTIQGFPLLATSPGYLQPRERYPLAGGRVFESGMEVVAGSAAAVGLGVDLGDRVSITHPHAGGDGMGGSLRVVGVLAATGTDADHGLFCPLEAVFESHDAVHAHHDHAEQRVVSAVLVRPESDDALLQLQEELGSRPGIEVALTGQTLRRIADRLSWGGRLLQALVAGVVLLTFGALLLSIYGTSLTGVREVAVMRVLGARRVQVLGIALTMVAAVVATGTAGGVVLGSVLGEAAEGLLRGQMGLEAQVTVFTPGVALALAAMAALLGTAGLQPALAAYSVEAVEALAEVPGAGGSARRALAWVPRVVLPLVVVAWGLWAFSQHDEEIRSLPLDPESLALFTQLASGEPDLPEFSGGQSRAIEGYMYALGDPFTIEDFQLVAINPWLPTCPFCYRAPRKGERILVRTGGRTLDVCSGPVRVTGVLGWDDGAVLDMTSFEVMLP